MNKKKLAAPIVVSVLLMLWLVGWLAGVCVLPGLPLPLKLVEAIVPLAAMGVTVYVLVERVNEIRSGEEDDLDNY